MSNTYLTEQHDPTRESITGSHIFCGEVVASSWEEADRLAFALWDGRGECPRVIGILVERISFSTN